MNTAIRADDVAHLANFKRIGVFLEWLLHHSSAEPAKVTTMRMGGAVRVLFGKFGELLWTPVDLLFVALEDLNGFLLGASNIALGKVIRFLCDSIAKVS